MVMLQESKNSHAHLWFGVSCVNILTTIIVKNWRGGIKNVDKNLDLLPHGLIGLYHKIYITLLHGNNIAEYTPFPQTRKKKLCICDPTVNSINR